MKLHLGDCLDVLKEMQENTIDSIITDPPYGLSMSRTWDYDLPKIEIWQECLRVLKPGGHLASFGGSKTYHRMCCAIEDAGFEIRDCILWIYSQGWPKSLDVAKSIDKAARGFPQGGADPTSPNHGKFKSGCSEENPTGKHFGAGPGSFMREAGVKDNRELVEEAKPWRGFGTALKPSYEPIILARKPLEGTVVQNVLKYGTGALNIDACRVPTKDNLNGGAYAKNGKDRHDGKENWRFKHGGAGEYQQPEGRWPANIILDADGSVDGYFPFTKSGTGAKKKKSAEGYSPNSYGKESRAEGTPNVEYGDSGSASRIFYHAKPSRAEKGEYNKHPTVKSRNLISYLVLLCTPPGGIVLDPFMGSGTTGISAFSEGFDFIGIEKEKDYFEIAERRINEVSGAISRT